MRKALAVICLAGLLLSGCSVVRKVRESKGEVPQSAQAPPQAPAPAAAAEPPPPAPKAGGIVVNALMATRMTQDADGYKVEKPHQHTIIAGSPELQVILIRIDGLTEGQHTLKLQFKIDPAPADWLAAVEKDPKSQGFLQRYGAQLRNGWMSEVTKRFEVTKNPGDWAAHLFVDDLLMLAWSEGVRQVDIFVDEKLVHQLPVRILKAESVLQNNSP